MLPGAEQEGKAGREASQLHNSITGRQRLNEAVQTVF